MILVVINQGKSFLLKSMDKSDGLIKKMLVQKLVAGHIKRTGPLLVNETALAEPEQYFEQVIG